ncbi:MAG: aldehyde dehydrogenase [Spirochaetaceae bacterium]|jgi:aldehyde dehydrogenase (NAD+)|nr:aldehyde dehydrogenase [Spirochaetaceae bacterium]
MEGIDSTEMLIKQRAFFESGKTRPRQFRSEMLRKLKEAILSSEQDILAALHEDLGKSDFEAYATEVSIVLNELSYAQRHLRSWMRPRRASTGIINFPSHGRVYPDPYGVCLIMSPWNYPFQLAIAPLVAAIAAGNTVVLKPSNYAPAVSAVMAKLLESAFPPEYITVIQGGREANQGLLKEQFDYIFFTGGVTVGKLVMESASRYLTPVTLELGGKSPCIVDETADIKVAAKRIAWGKCINSGQTCVAPDYILAHESIKQELISEIGKNITRFFGADPSTNPEFPKIINAKHFQRLSGLLKTGKLAFGGSTNEAERRIAPTVFEDVRWEDPIMQEEIFGPILPVITFTDLNDAIASINRRPHPLALYLFTSSKEREKRVLSLVRFGGGCVNDTVMHLTSDSLPFGGVGESGMGNYHGKSGFDTFTHYKSVLKKSTAIDVPARYPPYKGKYRLLRPFI